MRRHRFSQFAFAAIAGLYSSTLAADQSLPATQAHEGHSAGVERTAPVRVATNPGTREVLVTVDAIEIPGATSYAHHSTEVKLQFTWPVDRWLRGYRIDLLDGQGRLLPRDLLHHAGIANLDRRQLAYPLVERLLAAGKETRPAMLPESMAVPLAKGQNLLLYYALTNPSDAAVKNVTLRVTLTWSPEHVGRPKALFPLTLDANPAPIGGATRAFDVQPGVTSTSAEFTLPMAGYLRAVGAHMHDHAVEIRLEDVQTGKVLARLKTKRKPDGTLVSIDVARFIFSLHGKRLLANHPYRVTAVYDNPAGTVLPNGAMAYMIGAFIPDDVKSWPAIDPANAHFKDDLAGLLNPGSHAHGHGGR
jgi:hypothetical protein